MQSVLIQKNHAGQRLDKFLHKYLPLATTSFLYKMLRKKNIVLNGKKVEGKEILCEKDEVTFFFSDETILKFRGVDDVNNNFNSNTIHSNKKIESLPLEHAADTNPMYDDSKKTINENSKTAEYYKAYRQLKNIQIIYEDDNILILNKPVDMLSQKAEKDSLSINEWMIGYLLHNNTFTEDELTLFKPSICNRLDRNTTGIILCGKSLEGSQLLNHLIKTREIKKFYRTIVAGKITSSCQIEGYLSKNEKTNTVSISKNPNVQKKEDKIKTSYEPISILKNKYTYLEVELITGKTHQIRAHLSSIGHPIIGDYKYGTKVINENITKDFNQTKSTAERTPIELKFQLLHAYRIEFPIFEGNLLHLSGKIFTAPLPKHFQQLM